MLSLALPVAVNRDNWWNPPLPGNGDFHSLVLDGCRLKNSSKKGGWLDAAWSSVVNVPLFVPCDETVPLLCAPASPASSLEDQREIGSLPGAPSFTRQ